MLEAQLLLVKNTFFVKPKIEESSRITYNPGDVLMIVSGYFETSVSWKNVFVIISKHGLSCTDIWEAYLSNENYIEFIA